MAHSLKLLIFTITIITGFVAWSFTNTYKMSSSAIADTMLSKINEPNDQTSAMMDNKIQELDLVRPASVAADAIFEGYSGTKSNSTQLLDGATQIVEERKHELLISESNVR